MSSKGIELIAAERERQVTVEGWTPEHDAQHNGYELAAAGVTYAQEAIRLSGNWVHTTKPAPVDPSSYWPWEAGWWKPSDDPIRNLVKAGALIAAEIDRLLATQKTD